MRSDRSYIVTGGTGGIGRHLVPWLVAQGAGQVWVLGRSEPGEDTVADFGPQGWSFVAVDVGERDALQQVLEDLPAQGPALGGVFHAAVTSADRLLRSATINELRAVWRAKVDGATWLHELTHDLDCFVLFSSAVAWFGRPGQGLYGAANAYLDGLAQHRAARGLPAVSVAFGPWADVGLSAGHGEGSWAAEGVRPLDPEDALAVVGQQLSGPASVAVFAAEWPRFVQRYIEGPPAELMGLPGVPEQPMLPGEASSLVHRLRQARPRERQSLLQNEVTERVQALLDRDAEAPLGAHRGFFEVGMDSLMAVELSRRLGRRLDLPLPPTLAFDHPDIASMTAFLLQELELEPVEPAAAASAVERDDPVAIVAMACRFPGADTPEALWALLERGEHVHREVPGDRWDIDAWYAPPGSTPTDTRTPTRRMYVRGGGFLERIDAFDPEFFGISPREAASLDPQQRLLLEVCWEALERGGFATSALRGSRTGVFVGITDRGYLDRFQRPGRTRYPDAWSGTGNDPSFAPGRVAHALGLQGPVLALDTTCSSSLVALHLAARALTEGECDAALAGGVSLMLLPDDTAYLCALGALSPTERCHTFDAAADGYARAEGCGMVLLKRLSDAERDGDTVLAVLRGSAVNHDGASAGLTVPNGAAQQAVLREALARSGASPWDVGYLEAHGTGTSLGDPIEVRAATAVYGERRGRPALHLGALKANLGHLELAAGVASVIKTVMVLQQQRIPPQPLQQLNPNIVLDGATVSTRAVPWPEGTRLAAVSAFGLSGTNAHVLLSRGPEADLPTSTARERPVHLLGLSARSEASLRQLAERLGPVWAQHPLPTVAASLHARQTFEVRAAVVAADAREAAAQLPELKPTRVVREPVVALVFSGQGSEVPRQGDVLAKAFPLFAEHVRRCAEVLDPLLPRPLSELLAAEAPLGDTPLVQPVLMVIGTGLAALLQAWGVRPSAVAGHSLGELTAATVAGVWSLEAGLRLAATRGRLMAERTDAGAMAVVYASPTRWPACSSLTSISRPTTGPTMS